MRRFLLLAAGLLLSAGLFSQAVAYSDNFESYTVGDYIAVQSGEWTTWSNDPGSAEDAFISDEQALSGMQSVKIEGSSDLVKPLGNKISGKYWVELNMYIPTGYGGYYNLQKFEEPGTEWGVQTYFGADGNGSIDAGAEGAATFTFDHDTWINIVNVVDLDNDLAQVWIDGVMLVEWPWSLGTFGDPGAIQLGSINMFAGAPTGDDPLYYFDDVYIEQLLSPFYEDDFESYEVGDFIGVENPDWWTTWSGSPGTGEDAYIADTYANSPTQSLFIDPDDGLTDAVLKLGNKTSGAYDVDWSMYVESGYNGYYNFQHFESPGTEWAFDLLFYDPRNGQLMVGDETFTFTFPQDEWFTVEHDINIDGDWAEFYVNGTMVHAWPFSYTTLGTSGTNQLGGVDIWTDDDTYKFYIDDMYYSPKPIDLYMDDFEEYTVGEYIAVVNPEWWTTWSGATGGDEDALITDDYANSDMQSILCDSDPGLTDLILKLGDRVSGAYDLNWYIYVESGTSGYYNIQHFESPGTEWAFDVYFNDDGTGELYAGSDVAIPFTYTPDTWVPVMHQINLDDDWIVLTIEGEEIYSWPFSWQSTEPSGTLQLGGVDFFTDSGMKFYVDDVEFIQTQGELDPVISVMPETLEATAPTGSTTTETLTIENTGASTLDWEGVVIYDIPGMKSAPVSSLNGQAKVVKSLASGGSGTSLDPDAKPASYNPVSDDVTLNYDGDNSSAIGWNSPPITPTVAAMFPASMTNPYAGMYIFSVDVYINDLNVSNPNTMTLKIFDMGTSYGAGELLYEQEFEPFGLSWNTIMLDDPVYITGADIWVGYQFTQHEADIFIPGTDAGPNDPNGDWITTGVGWSNLSDNPDLPYNWNIRANLTGDPIPQWLMLDPMMGSVEPGDMEEVTVTFDATDVDPGTYTATIRMLSNDPENSQVDIPVTFTVEDNFASVVLDFEDVADWAQTFDPWTAVDNDGANTYGITDVEFPGMGDPLSFIAFNPATTDPPMTDDPEIQPYEGERFGACMASIPPPTNDDWMISPQITLGTDPMLKFFVKSYTDQYGLEKYNVAVSTTGMNPEDFDIISGPDPLEAPADMWEMQEWDLSDYTGEDVYVAINCVSEDAFIFMLDSVAIEWQPVGIPENPAEAQINVYPNPATDQVNITSSEEMTRVAVFNYLGQKVYEEAVKNREYRMNVDNLTNGVYYLRIQTDSGLITRKIMVQ